MASPGLEVYNVSDQGLADVYLIQGYASNTPYTGQLEQYGAMYTDGTQEFYVDQSLYYPPATSYGYVCTGFEPTGDWEEHHRLFGMDGQDILYNGSTNESMPYLFYAPNNGYGQSAYNPYNPYIPGAVMGVDGSVIAAHSYYSFPSYENSVTPPAYAPLVVQATPDTVANGITGSFVNNVLPINQTGSHVTKSNFPKLSATGNATTQMNSFLVPEVNGANAVHVKQPLTNVSSGSFSSRALSQVPKARGQQSAESGLSGKAPTVSTSPKTAFTSANGLSGSEAQNPAGPPVHKVKPKLLETRGSEDTKVRVESPGQQNQGARLNASKKQLVVKARTTRAGNPDDLGNITIFADWYNSSDFPTDYVNAKFFVIKSYSEDDVHKSIKYNVWSSTPNGNRKLNAAYGEAQRLGAGSSRSCPIFFFFSVNASGQYCGVAEMIGPVDFDKDMDFWQQDKWSGSFPVKWHFVKDVPNPNFRHIILENNENKPVTNSRDTQEIPMRKGLAMLQIFKSYTLKTSLLDDFMYYENRQQIMHEERTRLLMKSYGNPYLVPLVDPPRKLHNFHDFPSFEEANANKLDSSLLKKNNSVSDGKTDVTVTIAKPPKKTDGVENAVDELKMNKLSIHSKEVEPESSSVSPSNASTNVVTIGSMPVNVKGAESSVFLTVGTIPLDPRALQRD